MEAYRTIRFRKPVAWPRVVPNLLNQLHSRSVSVEREHMEWRAHYNLRCLNYSLWKKFVVEKIHCRKYFVRLNFVAYNVTTKNFQQRKFPNLRIIMFKMLLDVHSEVHLSTIYMYYPIILNPSDA